MILKLVPAHKHTDVVNAYVCPALAVHLPSMSNSHIFVHDPLASEQRQTASTYALSMSHGMAALGM